MNAWAKSLKGGVIAAAILGLVSTSIPAEATGVAATTVVITGHSYVPGDVKTQLTVQILEGTELKAQHAEPLTPHTLTSKDFADEDETERLFATKTRENDPKAHQFSSGTVRVVGTAGLEPGIYDFFCEVHGPLLMSGRLEVI